MKVLKILSKMTKIAVVISFIAIIAAVSNIFLQIQIVRIFIWAAVAIAITLDILAIEEINIKLIQEKQLLAYELDQLQWSYKEMGRYISRMDIPELADIETRIDNELRDIEIKKSWYAERRGIVND